MLENGFWGFGRYFAPLSDKGKEQAEIMVYVNESRFILCMRKMKI